MADTLQNIEIAAGEWQDIYALTGIAVGTKIHVQNIGECDVYLAVQATQPPTDHNDYNILKRNSPKMTNSAGDSGAWAFCGNYTGKLNVSVQSSNGFNAAPLDTDPAIVRITDETSRVAMVSLSGDLHTGSKQDDITVNFQYGVSTRDIVDGGATSGTGTIGAANSMASVSSGAGVGEASLTSRDVIRYRAGHETHCALSVILGTPEVGVDQFAGFLNGDDGWCFGYQGTTFGLWFIEGTNENFTPWTDFSIDKLDGFGPSGYNINPQTGQLYRLSYGWHGFLDLIAEVSDDKGRWIPVHRISSVNSATEPHLQNPNLPVAIKVRRATGAGADVTIKTASWRGGVVAGREEDNSSNRWFPIEVLDRALAANVRNNIVTVRNKATYQGKKNHIVAELGVVDFVNDANKTVLVRGTLNGTLAGNTAFTDVDTLNSVLSFSTGGTVTGGTTIPAAPVKANDQRTREVRGTGIKIFPGQDFTIEIPAGASLNGFFTLVARFVEYH